MNGYWMGGNDSLLIFLSIQQEIIISIPSEDLWGKIIRIKQYQKNHLRFIIYNFLIDIIKVNSDILYGSFKISGFENKKYTLVFQRSTAAIFNSKIYINRLDELRTGQKYLFEKCTSDIFQYPDISIGDYYKKIREQVPVSIGDCKNEIEIVKRILNECHSRFRHNGKIDLPMNRSGIELIDYAQKVSNNYLNCRGLALILTDVFLAYGFKAKSITCVQREQRCIDSHVVVHVYSKEYKKWIYTDPSYNLMINNEEGEYLSLEEIREYVIEEKFLGACKDAKYNNNTLDFNAFMNTFVKKLYRFYSPILIFPGYDDVRGINEIELIPQNEFCYKDRTTSNPLFFWKTPEGKEYDERV